jgi:hypothetical protein
MVYWCRTLRLGCRRAGAGAAALSSQNNNNNAGGFGIVNNRVGGVQANVEGVLSRLEDGAAFAPR